MPGWLVAAIIAFSTLVVLFLLGVCLGRMLRNNRLMLEAEAIDRCRRAITKFLNSEKDNAVMMYRDRESGIVKSEEALEEPDQCVVCVEYGCADDEDLRPDLVSIRNCYIPLCASHKRFVAQCLVEKIPLDDGPNSPSV